MVNDESEYEGGRLCFVDRSNGLQVRSRNTGDITVHGNLCLHGVTKLEKGIRYSLFIVNRQNGLGDETVVHPTYDEVETLVAKAEEIINRKRRR